MNLLKNSQTNWKYILIVAILTAIVGGGILWFSARKEVSIKFLEIKKSEKIAEDKAANWITYKNEVYGYQVKLPEDWEKYGDRYEMTIAWSDIKNNDRSVEISIVCKGGKMSEEWILGKSTIYENYQKLKEVTIEGIETIILEEPEKEIGTSYRRKIVFIPRNDYVYIIRTPYPFVSDDDFDLILSTFKFTDIKEELLGWENFWAECKRKGCYDIYIYKPKCPYEEIFNFPNRTDIPFTEYSCFAIEKFAKENPVLHKALLEGEGAIEDSYRVVWASRGENWVSMAIQVGYIDLTNDGGKDAIVVHRGGAAMRSFAVGIFQLKEGVYYKLLDKGIGYSNFEVENAQLVEIAPVYVLGDPECCPSSYIHIYYKFIEGEFKVDKAIDNYGHDITEIIYSPLRSCSYEEPQS